MNWKGIDSRKETIGGMICRGSNSSAENQPETSIGVSRPAAVAALWLAQPERDQSARSYLYGATK